MTTPMPVGDLPQIYAALRPFLNDMPWNDRRNADNCAWLVAGCIHSRRCSVIDWVSGRISNATTANSREIQGYRFLKNKNVVCDDIYGRLVFRALKSWGKGCLKLALDTSMLFNRFCLIRIAILFRGRAVPLCQKVIEHGSAQVSLNQLLPLIAQAKGILDALGITNVRFLADRGFCDVELMDWLLACGWNFRIRIKSSLLLADAQGRHLCRLHQIKLAAGESQFHQNVTLTAKHFGPVYLALGRPTDDSEQWQVVSSEPTDVETFAEYGERFQIEEGFLDDKSSLMGLEESKLRDTESLNRLVMILAIATLFLVSQGIEFVSEGTRRMFDGHWQRGISYLKIGLRAVHWALSRGQAVFQTLALRGGEDPEPLGKRKAKGPDPLNLLRMGKIVDFAPLS